MKCHALWFIGTQKKLYKLLTFETTSKYDFTKRVHNKSLMTKNYNGSVMEMAFIWVDREKKCLSQRDNPYLLVRHEVELDVAMLI